MPHALRFDAGFQANDAVDLSTCASEPIHIPGMIQPHGLLLVLEETGLIIRRVSENSVELVNVPPDDQVGRPLVELLGPDQNSHMRMILRGDEFLRGNPLKLRLPNRPEGREFNVLVHKVDRELVFEAEPIQDEDIGNSQNYYHEVRLASARLQATESEETLCQLATDELRRIVGYERVMVYRFDADWNGMAIAESRDGESSLNTTASLTPALPQPGPGGGFPLVPTLHVGMPSGTLRVPRARPKAATPSVEGSGATCSFTIPTGKNGS